MWHSLYLAAMVSFTLAVTAIGANALLLKRCAHCGARSLLDARACRRCGQPFAAPPETPPATAGHDKKEPLE